MRVSCALVPGGDVYSWAFEIAGGSERVVYLAEQDVDGLAELYSAPLDGGPAVKLNAPLLPGERLSAGAFELSPDGRRVVYLGIASIEGVRTYRLHAAPLDGSTAPVRLNGPHFETFDEEDDDPQVFEFRIAPDGSRVVYLADQEFDGRQELWSVPADGAQPPNRLHPPLASTRDVESFELDPTGARVVYLSDEAADGVLELWSAPVDGSVSPVRLHPALPPTADVLAFRIDPRGRSVAYLRGGAGLPVELFRVSILGGSRPLRVNGPLVAGGGVRAGGDAFAFAPDGGRILYLAEQRVDGEVELFATRFGAGALGSDPP